MADTDRMNCRENLNLINMEKNAALTLLLEESSKPDQSSEATNQMKAAYFADYYYLYKKSMERERMCDNDLILKIFSPESKDLK